MKKFKVVYVSNCRGENYPVSLEIKEAQSGEALCEQILEEDRQSIIKQLEKEEGRELTEEEERVELQFHESSGPVKDREGVWWLESNEEDFTLVIEEDSAFYEKVDKFIDGDLEEDEWEEWNEFTEPCS